MIKYSNSIERIVTVDTSNLNSPKEDNDIFVSRANVFSLLHVQDAPKVSILIIAYNRIEKTKNCVESVLKYTSEIDYELVLVDNGSTDETLDYFNSIEHVNKKIIHITKNLQLPFGVLKGSQYCNGKYIAFLNNDMVVTKNWLSNLLACLESDEHIGMVCAMSSNVSNLQQADIKFKDFDEMQLKAAEYNISDSQKWHERIRLITTCAVYKAECINTCGNWDCGFYHDFADDDLTFHIRRTGYKTILCKDVFIHHDHAMGSGKSPEELEKSLKKGRENFRKKYFGIDPWEDTNNFEAQMISMVEPIESIGNICVLGVDVRCGTPILEFKNKLRSFGLFNVELNSFSEHAKYYTDLSSICDGMTSCDRIEHISEYFTKGQFDFIVLGKELNLYSEPLKLLIDCLSMLKDNGRLLLKLRNTYDIQVLLHILGDNEKLNEDYAVQWSLDDLNKWVLQLGYSIKEVTGESYQIDKSGMNRIEEIMNYARMTHNIRESLNNMLVRNYVVSIGI